MNNPCPLYIYFLDDSARTSTSQQVENPFPIVDTGRCRLLDQDIAHCLPRWPPSDCSPRTWFFLPTITPCVIGL
ncbi:hypothetical protein E2562_017972 [Oryza meyeriana var. granulata]|uniref:Uncharacterized protein n=1 Tax=Oryza meyeriana var. granulata TaxID=110450 RepID=A0A6G1F8X7_9ORYZ|nr:hypothetical protein E2562_017972 [Oryza meyeriana var. granulata]